MATFPPGLRSSHPRASLLPPRRIPAGGCGKDHLYLSNFKFLFSLLEGAEASFPENLRNPLKAVGLGCAIAANSRKNRPIVSCAKENGSVYESGSEISLKMDDFMYFEFACCFLAMENRREDKLFEDPYAPHFLQNLLSLKEFPSSYEKYYEDYVVSTYFIDSQIMSGLRDPQLPIKQVILLSNGLDTRPFRLCWPKGTIIFQISPEETFHYVTSCLKSRGIDLPKGCYFRHLPTKLSEQKFAENLLKFGYRANQPSIWIIQNLIDLDADSFESILEQISSLAMSNSLILGQVLPKVYPSKNKEDCLTQFGSLFGRYGLLFQSISPADVARELGRTTPLDFPSKFYTSAINDVLQSSESDDNGTFPNYLRYPSLGYDNTEEEGKVDIESFMATNFNNLLFVSSQQRFSDLQAQMLYDEIWAAEEDGDEMGFEDMP